MRNNDEPTVPDVWLQMMLTVALLAGFGVLLLTPGFLSLRSLRPPQHTANSPMESR